MPSIESIQNMERDDRESALTLVKSLASQITNGNYNASLSTLGSIAIVLASAESNHRMAHMMANTVEKKGGVA